MASKHDIRSNTALTSEEIEERLQRLGKLIDRLKVMYEQYFMGIQKLAPAQLHRDAERHIRELTQINIRNTALRFRFANVTQKFGSYNTYWKRTMRQIESGTYRRHVLKAARKAAAAGTEIPEEILAAMPKRIREKILRDRERMQRFEERKRQQQGDLQADSPVWRKEAAISESELGDFNLGDMNDDFDLDNAFAGIMADATAAVTKHKDTPAAKPAPAPPAKPAPAAKPAPPPAATAKPPPTPRRRAARPPIPSTRAARPARAPTPRPSPRPAARAKPASPTSPIPGMSVAETQALHRRYNQGQKMINGGKQVSYDKLMKTLQRQAPKIIKQHNAKGVSFSVAIKNDKVILKAKPKKE